MIRATRASWIVHVSTQFSTADVVVVGARLGKLVELINAHDLDSVSVVDARHAGLRARAPWVASIAIARLDKSGRAAG